MSVSEKDIRMYLGSATEEQKALFLRNMALFECLNVLPEKNNEENKKDGDAIAR